jgi:predicted TIM-barrel fold metal-dependent hydrolase
MWGSDYPHQESTFPKSREILEKVLADVPEDEKVKIAGSNVARLYHFN